MSSNIAEHTGQAPDRANQLALFISYSRKDVGTADRLVAALGDEGFTVYIDHRDLPFGEEWQRELADSIRASDTVVWLVSPASVTSKWCRWELGEVSRLSKRLVPVVISDVDRAALPEELGRIHLLPSVGAFDKENHFEHLVRALNTNRAWIKEHTRLADDARQWIHKDRDPAHLLRGAALRDAEIWTDDRPQLAPSPTDEILEWILASRRSATKRQRWTIGGALAVAVFSIGLAAVTFWQRSVAEAQRKEVQLTQSRFLADSSNRETDRGDATTGALLALEALPDEADRDTAIQTRPYWPAAELSLERALQASRQRAMFIGHTANVNSVTFADHGRLVVTGSDDGTARIWDVARQSERVRLEGHTDGISSVAVADNAPRLITGSRDATAGIWDVPSGALLTRLRAGTAPVSSVAINADASVAFTASSDGVVRSWDVATGEELGSTALPRAFQHGQELSTGIPGISAVGNGATVAIATNRGQVVLWDTRTGDTRNVTLSHTGKSRRELTFVEPPRLFSIAAPQNGAVVATIGSDKFARIWTVANGAETGPPLGHTAQSTAIAITPNGQSVVTGSDDGTARRWNASTGAEAVRLIGHQGAVLSVAISADARVVLTGSADHTARLWDARTSEERLAMPKEEFPVKFLKSGTDDRIVVGEQHPTSSGPQWNVKVVNLQTGQAQHKQFVGPEDLTGVSLHPDSSMVFIATSWRGVRLWDVSTNAMEEVPDSAGTAVMAPNSARFATVSGATVQVWNTAKRERVQSLVGHRGPVNAVAFSADAKRVFTGSDDGTVRVWDSDLGREIQRLTDSASVIAIAVTPDGNRVASATKDVSVRFWNAITGDTLSVFRDVRSPVGDLVTTADGGRIVGLMRDGVSIWDSKSGNEIARIIEPNHRLTAVAIMPDGRLLLGGSDGSVQLREMRTSGQDLVTTTKKTLTQCLTPKQRETYFLSARAPAWCEDKWPYDQSGNK